MRSASGPMLRRGSPLLYHFYTINSPVFGFWIARCTMSRLGDEPETPKNHSSWDAIGTKSHVYQEYPNIGSLLDYLYPQFCIFSRPLHNVPPRWKRLRWLPYLSHTQHFSLAPNGPTRLKHMHLEVRSISGHMFIRGYPLLSQY